MISQLEKIIGYCGIVCSDCPVFLATKINDDTERKRVADLFTKQYKREYTSEEINCDGCTSDSLHLFHYCGNCVRRKCARDRNLKNCAYCPEYPCAKLAGLFSAYPRAKETLDKIRLELAENKHPN